MIVGRGGKGKEVGARFWFYSLFFHFSFHEECKLGPWVSGTLEARDGSGEVKWSGGEETFSLAGTMNTNKELNAI